MFYSRLINKKIKRLHERCLRIIYDDKQSLFKELLEKDSSVSILERNTQILATEMYKVSKFVSPPQINKLFARRNNHPYNLRHNAKFFQPFLNYAFCETKGSKIWGIVPVTYKKMDSLYYSKNVIKKWKLVFFII